MRGAPGDTPGPLLPALLQPACIRYGKVTVPSAVIGSAMFSTQTLLLPVCAWFVEV